MDKKINLKEFIVNMCKVLLDDNFCKLNKIYGFDADYHGYKVTLMKESDVNKISLKVMYNGCGISRIFDKAFYKDFDMLELLIRYTLEDLCYNLTSEIKRDFGI